MRSAGIPEVVVLRLPLYVRALNQLALEGEDVVNSQRLGRRLRMTPAQIRKDLSYFGRFGKQGSGYKVEFLRDQLKHLLGLDREWLAGLVGVGRLGRAIVNYPGFIPEGFRVVAAFDSDPEKVGNIVGGMRVQQMSELHETITSKGIVVAIVAVPAKEAQSVVDALVASNIRGILNYAPVAPELPSHVVIRHVDPVLSLQSMTFYLG